MTYALRTGTLRNHPVPASRFSSRARARARTPPRLLSARVPAIQEPRTPRFEQRVRPPWPPRARALSRVELTSPRSSTPSRRRGRSRELRLRAHGIPGTRFPPTPFSNPPASRNEPASAAWTSRISSFPATRARDARWRRRGRATASREILLIFRATSLSATSPTLAVFHLAERLTQAQVPVRLGGVRWRRGAPFTARAPPWRCWARARRPQGWEGGDRARRSGVGGKAKRDDHVRGGTSRDRSRILKRSPRSFRALENGRAKKRKLRLLARRKPFVRDDERSF